MFKRVFTLLLVILMLFSLAACSAVKEPPVSPSENADTSQGVSYPMTVTDQAGRQVVITKAPEKLVSCYYITTSLLMALDLDEQLVGVENNADLRPIYGLSNPQILQLPSIGTAKEVDIEACAALMPDLAILPMKVKDSADDLEALGISVLLVNPESQELLMEMIRLVAAVTDREERANQLITFIETQETRLTEQLSTVETPSVYLSGNSNFLSTAGNAMYQSDMIRLAGGKNVAGEIQDTYWAQIDYEQLLAWNPEYIILPSSSKYTVQDILTDPNLSACLAVEKGQVYQVPADAESWDSPVPGSILGAWWLAGILHPQEVSVQDSSSIMKEYYETFYGFTYTQN